jgi:uncharacterized protein
VRTHSRHYLANPDFRAAVAAALANEAQAVDAYVDELRSHSPYADHSRADHRSAGHGRTGP